MSEELVKRLLEPYTQRQSRRVDAEFAAADRIKELEAKLAKAVEAGVDVAASLSATISILERGGKKAAASDKMFAQMLVDYNESLNRFRATLAELTGGQKDGDG